MHGLSQKVITQLPVVLMCNYLFIYFLSSADVSITLHNKGRDAYKPEVYGQAITVDLRITREGMRTYKLRSKSGKELEELCLTYAATAWHKNVLFTYLTYLTKFKVDHLVELHSVSPGQNSAAEQD